MNEEYPEYKYASLKELVYGLLYKRIDEMDEGDPNDIRNLEQGKLSDLLEKFENVSKFKHSSYGTTGQFQVLYNRRKIEIILVVKHDIEMVEK